MTFWRDKDALERELRAHGWSNRATAETHGCAESSIRTWRKRHGITGPTAKGGTGAGGERPGVTVDGDEARIITDPRKPEDLGDLDGLLRRRGLNPDEWEVAHVGVNEWEAYAGRDDDQEPIILTLRQLKCTLKRRAPIDWLFPAVEVEQRYVAGSSTRTAAGDLIVFVGDQQAPYHDEELHAAFLLWLTDVAPAGVVLLGDVMDLPTISRHPDKAFWNAPPQECIDVAYRLYSDYRDAAPTSWMKKLRGNHDIRLEAELLTRAERMFGLRPAEIPGTEQVPGYSIRRFLHLDALGIELVGREGDEWKLAELEVAPGLAARHKPPTREKWLRLSRDVVAGDTHRQSIDQVTAFAGEEAVIRTVVEAGCMCLTNGLGYDEHPDWQPGFATATVLPDGGFSYDLATWRRGRLTWRGEQW